MTRAALLKTGEVRGAGLTFSTLRSNPGVCWPPCRDRSPVGSDEGIIAHHAPWLVFRMSSGPRSRGSDKGFRRVDFWSRGFSHAANSLRCLQDTKRRRAWLARKPSAKGLVQSVRGSSDGSGMTVTNRQIPHPSGRDITKHGIFAGCVGEDDEREIQRSPLEDNEHRKTVQYRAGRTLLVSNAQNPRPAPAKPYNHQRTFCALESLKLRALYACCLAIRPVPVAGVS